LGSAISGAGQASGGPAIDAFNSLAYPSGAGHVPAVEYFLDLSSGYGTSNAINANIYQRNAMPILTWQPQNMGGNDQWVADGGYDAFLTAFAKSEAADGRPLYIRFGHEMNGQWYPWAPFNNGNTSASYVAMWRHVVTLFRANGASNVRWVWCANVGQNDFTPDYPGDAYVDYVGLDGYNWGSSMGSWQSFKSIFGNDYGKLTALSAKPVIIGETSSSEIGGSKGSWISQGFLSDVPQSFPRIKAILWFNENKEQDWRIDSSAGSLAAYQQVAASPRYHGTLP
jgi:beta-mannanase